MRQMIGLSALAETDPAPLIDLLEEMLRPLIDPSNLARPLHHELRRGRGGRRSEALSGWTFVSRKPTRPGGISFAQFGSIGCAGIEVAASFPNTSRVRNNHAGTALWMHTVAFVIFTLTAGSGFAQTVGTFRWQFTRYCNTVTVLVEQKGSGYVLRGRISLWGGSARGRDRHCPHESERDRNAWHHRHSTRRYRRESFRPAGLPSALGHVVDDYGNSGTFLFNPGNPAGAPRPLTIRGNYAVDFALLPGGRGAAALSFGVTLAQPPIPHLVALGTSTPQSREVRPTRRPRQGICVCKRRLTKCGDRLCIVHACPYVCDTADRVGRRRREGRWTGGRACVPRRHLGRFSTVAPKPVSIRARRGFRITARLVGRNGARGTSCNDT